MHSVKTVFHILNYALFQGSDLSIIPPYDASMWKGARAPSQLCDEYTEQIHLQPFCSYITILFLLSVVSKLCEIFNTFL